MATIDFDLIELNGDDLRRDPLEVRKATRAGEGFLLVMGPDYESVV